MTPEIEFIDTRKAYQKSFELNIRHLKITKGSIICFVGNNGAGKTTLFKLIVDLILPDSGEVLIKGQDVRFNENWKMFTSCYLDESFLIDYLTPLEYFNFLCSLKGINKNEMWEQLRGFDSLLPVQIYEQEKLIRNYSTGNIQKIGITSCFILKPEIVILDEPFANLDHSSKLMVCELLGKYKAQGVTILLSTHDVELAHTTFDRVILLDKGEVVSDSEIDKEAGSERSLSF